MRLAVDIRHLATPIHTGIAQYTVELLHELIPMRPDVTFVLFSSGINAQTNYIPRFPYLNVEYHHFPLSNKLLALRVLFDRHFTLESLFAQQPDAFFFPNSHFIKTNLPYFITAHDISFELFPAFFTAKQRLWHYLVTPKRLFEGAHAILAVSRQTKRDIQNVFNMPKKTIHITPLGIASRYDASPHANDYAIRKQLGLPNRYFLSLASLEPRKNLAVLLQGYERFRQITKDKNPPALVFAGSAGWKNRSFLRQITQSPFKADIYRLSQFQEEAKPALYRGAQAFFFPSIYEGFGLPPLEALACGVPIVASQTGALAEVLDAHALLVNPFAPHDIAFAMEEIQKPEIRAFFIKNRDIITKRFTYKETAQRTADILFADVV